MCVPMPTAWECICCCELAAVENKKSVNGEDVTCISLHPGFEPVCLNVWVLETAYFGIRQQYGSIHQGTSKWF